MSYSPKRKSRNSADANKLSEQHRATDFLHRESFTLNIQKCFSQLKSAAPWLCVYTSAWWNPHKHRKQLTRNNGIEQKKFTRRLQEYERRGTAKTRFDVDGKPQPIAFILSSSRSRSRLTDASLRAAHFIPTEMSNTETLTKAQWCGLSTAAMQHRRHWCASKNAESFVNNTHGH